MMPKLAVHIFRRDYRLRDNTALIAALQQCKTVLPLFILDPNQIQRRRNPYFSQRAANFMLKSLEDLDRQLKQRGAGLWVREGEPVAVLQALYMEIQFTDIYFNNDYTPYSRDRDNAIRKWAAANGVSVQQYHDTLLLSPEGDFLTTKLGDSAYTKFTPFYNRYKDCPVAKPAPNKRRNYKGGTRIQRQVDLLGKYLDIKCKLYTRAGRAGAKSILTHAGRWADYGKHRDCLTYKTTELSAHNKFGTVSVREVYWSFYGNQDFIRQLYWRDFYYNIMADYNSFLPYNNAARADWKRALDIAKKRKLIKWQSGHTGEPIVDAAMHQLNHTGIMHNRARLIAADYLVRHLGINWRWGELYFARRLMDYCPVQNCYNWQWVASTAPWGRPPFRQFSPELQGRRFDPKSEYRRYWLPAKK